MEDIKTPEQELRELIAESKLVLSKLKKTLNVMLVIAGIVFIPFLYSFISVQVRLSDIENTAISKEEAYEKLPTKADIIYLQNDLYDLDGFSFVHKDGITEDQREKAYNKSLKKFNGDVSRGAEEE